jgi:hypothetical protein
MQVLSFATGAQCPCYVFGPTTSSDIALQEQALCARMLAYWILLAGL